MLCQIIFERGGAMDGFIGAIVGFVILIIIFLIAREIVMWYWKINEIVGLQKSILEELKKMNGKS